MRHSPYNNGVIAPCLRPLDVSDLHEVARVHCAAFPGSALTKLGAEAVRRYYLWQLTAPTHETYATAAWVDSRLVGFCVGGHQPTMFSGFWTANRGYLLWRLLTHPHLLGNPMFRERLAAAMRALVQSVRRARTSRRPQSEPTPVVKLPFDILSIAVDPQMQGTGIGKLLMLHAEEQARSNGFHAMSLGVRTDNHQAIRFYQGLGWECRRRNGVWEGRMEKWFERNPAADQTMSPTRGLKAVP